MEDREVAAEMECPQIDNSEKVPGVNSLLSSKQKWQPSISNIIECPIAEVLDSEMKQNIPERDLKSRPMSCHEDRWQPSMELITECPTAEILEPNLHENLGSMIRGDTPKNVSPDGKDLRLDISSTAVCSNQIEESLSSPSKQLLHELHSACVEEIRAIAIPHVAINGIILRWPARRTRRGFGTINLPRTRDSVSGVERNNTGYKSEQQSGNISSEEEDLASIPAQVRYKRATRSTIRSWAFFTGVGSVSCLHQACEVARLCLDELEGIKKVGLCLDLQSAELMATYSKEAIRGGLRLANHINNDDPSRADVKTIAHDILVWHCSIQPEISYSFELREGLRTEWEKAECVSTVAKHIM